MKAKYSDWRWSTEQARHRWQNLRQKWVRAKTKFNRAKKARPPERSDAVETLRVSPGVAGRKGGGVRPTKPGTTTTGPTRGRNTGPWRVALGFYVLLQLATTEMDSASRRGTLAGRSRRTRASAAGLVQIGFVSELSSANSVRASFSIKRNQG
jgi:hypothetical protein